MGKRDWRSKAKLDINCTEGKEKSYQCKEEEKNGQLK
jgi:hypothetical protein